MSLRKSYKTALSIGISLLSLWIAVIVASGVGWNPFGVNWSFANTGAFGDSFGPISALMASVAAISAIAAYQAQREEIDRLRQREIEEDRRRSQEEARAKRRERDFDNRQRQEDRRRAQQDERDSIRARHLAFENTFFQLLRSFQNIVSETDVGVADKRKTSRDAFNSMVGTFAYNVSAITGSIPKSWNNLVETYANDLNHYFRFLYHLINFVDQSDVEDKYFYIRLLRSNLSEAELVLIGLNCAYGEGREKFRPLIEKYALLHNMSLSARAKWKLSENFSGKAFDRNGVNGGELKGPEPAS